MQWARGTRRRCTSIRAQQIGNYKENITVYDLLAASTQVHYIGSADTMTTTAVSDQLGQGKYGLPVKTY
jgi:hypothetical protein